MGLFDMVLVKDNHVYAAASLADAVKAPRRANPDLPLEIEVRDLAELEQVLTLEPYPDRVMPVTYVNSSAELKAFCGRHGGTVCTSGNAEAILRWAFGQRPRVLFFPDQHLGRNTGHRLGVSDNEMLLLDAGVSADTIRSTRMFLWPGACNVHRRFRPQHLNAIKERHPDAKNHRAPRMLG